MTMAVPLLNGVDHCHLNVDDLAQAVTWYRDVLGFSVVPELAFWDEGKGPLTLEDQAKTIRLALFEATGNSKGIAFSVNAAQFLAWLSHLSKFDIKTVIADHDVTYSMYFKDCAGNSHEITSHDYKVIKKGLE